MRSAFGRARRARPRHGRSGALASLAIVWLLSGVAGAQEVEFGRSVSTSRSLIDWKGYFSGDMRNLITHTETTTVYEAKDNPPVRVGGIDLDPTRSSPVESTSVARYFAVPGDPEYGTIRVETRAHTATGETVDTAFQFKERTPRPPLAVGPMDGQEIEIPAREQQIAGRSFSFRSTSRTVEITALLVAPSFEDLIAGRNVREVREPGARLVEGSLRVVGPGGEVIGYLAGDVRIAHGVERVTAR
jgi:hypothetical protein